MSYLEGLRKGLQMNDDRKFQWLYDVFVVVVVVIVVLLLLLQCQEGCIYTGTWGWAGKTGL